MKCDSSSQLVAPVTAEGLVLWLGALRVEVAPVLGTANLSFSMEGAWKPRSVFRFLYKRIG